MNIYIYIYIYLFIHGGSAVDAPERGEHGAPRGRKASCYFLSEEFSRLAGDYGQPPY